MERGACSYRRYLEGDEQAFEQIVKEYRESLTYFIFGFVKDEGVAEDIAIDCFAYIAAYPKRYNFKVSLKTYLFMLGRSRAIDHLRRRSRRIEIPLDDVEAILISSQSLEDEYIALEREKLVRKAIDSLPEKMRTAVLLVYFEDFSYEETAKIMKASKKQVDNLLYRARERLRSIIGEEGRLFL